MVEVTQEARELIEAIIGAYHTTRLDKDFVPHILSRPRVQFALTAAQAESEALRAQLVEALAERKEDARIIGMSAERELALRAEVERLREALEPFADVGEYFASEIEGLDDDYGLMIYCDTLSSGPQLLFSPVEFGAFTRARAVYRGGKP